MLIRTSNIKTETAGLGRLLRSPETALSATVVIAFFLVSVAAVFAYVYTSMAINTAESIENSQELLGYLQTSVSTMNDMQLQADTYVRRGFVGAKSRYASERSTLEQCIQQVKRTGDDDGWRRWHLTYLELVAQKFQRTLDSAMSERESGNTTRATDNLSKSEKLLEVMKGRLLIIDVEERELLKQRLSEYTKNTQRSSTTFLCLGGFIFLFVVPLTFLLQRYMQASKNALLVEQHVAREVVKHAPIGIVQLDTEFRILDANSVFENFLIDMDFPVNTSIWDLLPDMPREDLSQTVQSGRPAIIKSVNITRFGDNRERNVYWDIAAWPIVDDAKVRSLIIMIEDISEKTILSHQKDVIQQTIAHDLKSPLIASNYIIQAVQKKLSEEKNGAGELLLRLKDSNENALSMVKNMLEIAKYRQGKEVLSSQPVNVSDVINHVIANLSYRCQLANVRVAVHISCESTVLITDKSALTHLIVNLLENSIKFSRSGGTVAVRVKTKNQRALIEVQNFGPGISEPDKRRLFTPYWQGELGKESFGGTGIGLFLCKQIAEALGGNISVHSEEEVGTTFTVELPWLQAGEGEENSEDSCVSFDPAKNDQESGGQLSSNLSSN